jgi:hypothetical protein
VYYNTGNDQSLQDIFQNTRQTISKLPGITIEQTITLWLQCTTGTELLICYVITVLQTDGLNLSIMDVKKFSISDDMFTRWKLNTELLKIQSKLLYFSGKQVWKYDLNFAIWLAN